RVGRLFRPRSAAGLRRHSAFRHGGVHQGEYHTVLTHGFPRADPRDLALCATQLRLAYAVRSYVDPEDDRMALRPPQPHRARPAGEQYRRVVRLHESTGYERADVHGPGPDRRDVRLGVPGTCEPCCVTGRVVLPEASR